MEEVRVNWMFKWYVTTTPDSALAVFRILRVLLATHAHVDCVTVALRLVVQVGEGKV